MERHLLLPESILGRIKVLFMVQLIKKAYGIFGQALGTERKRLEEKVESLYQEIRHFAQDFQNVLFDYYQLDNSLSRESLADFVVSTLLGHTLLYEAIIRLQRLLDKEKEEKVRRKLQLYQGLQPSNLDIPAQLCLDADTIAYFDKHPHPIAQQNPLRSQSEFAVRPNVGAHAVRSSALLMSREVPRPYEQSIQCLKSLAQYCDPQMKLRLVIYSQERIANSVQAFYAKHNQLITRQLGADEEMPILMYIVSQAVEPSVFSQMALMDQFFSSALRLSKSRFRFVQMQSCLQYLFSADDFERKLLLDRSAASFQ